MAVTQEHVADALYDARPPQRRGFAWAYAMLLLAGTAYVLFDYWPELDGYEVGILVGAGGGILFLAWGWTAIRVLTIAVAVLTFFALYSYAGDLARADTNFWLKYLLASQSAVMWMSAIYVLATMTYIAHLVSRSKFIGQTASGLTWVATAMGLAGMFIRWHESYLLGEDIGHIPVSNLYEVFILFCLITALIYLHYERRYQTRALGAFALPIISAAVAFLLWYSFDRGAHEIQPLVPALQSYWMKIHVPANFIGYGCFALAAMIGTAYLLRAWRTPIAPAGIIATTVPDLDLLDNIMYRVIGLGFAFFTVATILGALWAAEAWGGYWSWDPKETWALIVWLNYAAWLHMRISKGWHGVLMAWWSVIGLFITLFAFLGVNMFLSGLHSYGEL